MKFTKSLRPAAAGTAIIAAIAPRDLNIDDPGKCGIIVGSEHC